ncbi:hypothetical protein Tco_0564132 [Tanacetum coccineum]
MQLITNKRINAIIFKKLLPMLADNLDPYLYTDAVAKDLKKFQAELDRYHDGDFYASKVEIDYAKAKGVETKVIFKEPEFELDVIVL